MTNATPELSTRTTSPGAPLRQARADLHLSQEEVAAKLHLATHQIKALEEDDYNHLPGATYVRGYLKSYALLLGLAPGPILEAHARLATVAPPPSLGTITPQREITSRHHQVRFVTYVIVFIVIGLAVAWWQGRDTRPPNPLLAAHDAGLAAPAPETVSLLDEPQQAEKPAEEPPLAAASGTLASAQTAAAPAPLPVVAPAPVVPVPTGPRVNLVFRAEQDSWADIRDARQVKLLYETVPAGRTVRLEGVAPVSIFLGNAAGVRLDYNGQRVDIERHRRGMMARFTLGTGEDASAPVR